MVRRKDDERELITLSFTDVIGSIKAFRVAG